MTAVEIVSICIFSINFLVQLPFTLITIFKPKWFLKIAGNKEEINKLTKYAMMEIGLMMACFSLLWGFAIFAPLTGKKLAHAVGFVAFLFAGFCYARDIIFKKAEWGKWSLWRVVLCWINCLFGAAINFIGCILFKFMEPDMVEYCMPDILRSIISGVIVGICLVMSFGQTFFTKKYLDSFVCDIEDVRNIEILTIHSAAGLYFGIANLVVFSNVVEIREMVVAIGIVALMFALLMVQNLFILGRNVYYWKWRSLAILGMTNFIGLIFSLILIGLAVLV